MSNLDRSTDPTAVALDLTVRFAETDAMGIVHHSNYLVWFEAARVAWMDVAGVPYKEVAANGNHFAVIGVEIQYRAPARFGDVVRVTATVERIRSRQVIFAYTVHNADDGTLLATGRTDHISVDLAGRMASLPPTLLERLQAGIEQMRGSNDRG